MRRTTAHEKERTWLLFILLALMTVAIFILARVDKLQNEEIEAIKNKIKALESNESP
jgi:preprotein translocase subunit YajC